MCQALRDQISAARAGGATGGEQASGGIGFGMPATKQNYPGRMARTASAANFMALFGPQPAGA